MCTGCVADATHGCGLTGRGSGAAAADGFRRLLADRAHRVVRAVLPGPAGARRPVRR